MKTKTNLKAVLASITQRLNGHIQTEEQTPMKTKTNLKAGYIGETEKNRP